MAMHHIRKRFIKPIAFFLAFDFLFGLFIPGLLYASGSGPASPSFSSFESVSSAELVDPFSGNFTYNLPVLKIPGPDGSGYALSLSYHIGNTPDQEASWVGYGWTLNPGAITRNTNGFPDDYKEAPIIYHSKMPKHSTLSLSTTLGVEAFSISLAGNAGIRYNNYLGFAETYGFNLGAAGVASLSFTTTNGEGSWSGSVNPAGALSLMKTGDSNTDQTSRSFSKAFKSMSSSAAKAGLKFGGSFGNGYLMHTFSNQYYPVAIRSYTGTTQKYALSVQGDPSFLPFGVEGGLSGVYSTQENDPTQTINAFGYMYSGASEMTAADMQDYSIERNDAYNKHDQYLPLPYANPDQFVVSGEGIGGGFRAHHRQIGQFRPNEIDNQVNIVGAAVEVQLGSNIGIGGNLGTGTQQLEITNWENPDESDYSFPEDGDEPVYFRFNNDLGGYLSYGSDDKLEQAGFQKESGIPGFKEFYPTIPSGVKSEQNDGDRSGRSSYISSHTNSEIEEVTSGGISPRIYAYNRDPAALSFTSRTGEIADGIGEFAVANKDGNRYTYGIPVYVREEGTMQYGLNGQSVTMEDNSLAYLGSYNRDAMERISGFEQSTPYAKSWLLTAITSSEYVDVNLDGPTDDDLGGWTRFAYQRPFGSADKEDLGENWYRWRSPYRGLRYERGELSDPRDDMGAVRYGEKEVYYLDTIETKTHLASFYTSARTDGAEAADESSAATSMSAQGSDHLQKLDSIVLFTKENGVASKRLQRINFEYDYSLMQDRPDNSSSVSGEKGVLTLKKIWTDNYDTQNAKISPYTFHYDYKDPAAYATPVYDRYTEICEYGNAYSTSQENPDYSPANADAWGYYRPDGTTRTAEMNPWVDQSATEADFDPAAWQLKQIVLPSGGELLMQYEQKDYNHVQDKDAMALVRLDPSNSLDDGEDAVSWRLNKFYLDLTDLDIDATDTDALDDLVSMCNRQFVNGGEKIYFKFLYAIVGSSASLNNCNTEAIEGYSTVAECGRDVNGIFFVIGDEDDPAHYSTPKELCYDFAQTQRRGLLDPALSCGIRDNGTLGTDDNPETLIMALLNSIDEIGFMKSNHCLSIDYEHSYLRVPLTMPKKGNGMRIKRIMSYNRGLMEEESSLYGKEYIYEKEVNDRVISSGVVAFEPGSIREENPFVNLLPRTPQSWINKVVGGRDKKESEGPLGESMMPGGSVGYSRVIEKDIHEGKSAPGFIEKRFYTWEDYPVEVEVSLIEEKKDWMIIPLGFYNSNINRKWVTQGYVIKLNDFHGKQRSITTYSGDYRDPDSYVTSIKEEYFYNEPGTPITLFDDFGISTAHPGSEAEVIMAGQAVKDHLVDMAIEFDVSVGFLPPVPIPFVTAFPNYSDDKSDLYTHVTTKIVRQPAIMRGANIYKDGIQNFSANLMFESASGMPLVTQSTDGFNGSNLEKSMDHNGFLNNIDWTASQNYREMGQKAANEDFIMHSDQGVANGVDITKTNDNGQFKLNFDGDADHPVCDAMNMLYPGDLIRVTSSGGSEQEYFNVGDVEGSNILIYGSARYGFTDPGSDISMATIHVIRSGRTNQLSAKNGSVQTYGIMQDPVYQENFDPIREQLVAELNTKLNSGLNLFDINLHQPKYTNLMIDLTKGAGECTPTAVGTLSGYNYMIVDFTDVNGEGNICFSDKNIVTYTDDQYPKDSTFCYCSDEPVYFSPGDLPVGDFALDTNGTGDIIFYSADNPCHSQLIECLLGCEGPASWYTLENVLHTGTQTLDDNWGFDHDRMGYTDADYDDYNDYELGKRGKWRGLGNYNYRTQRLGLNASNPDGRVYNTGTFENYILFKWDRPDLSEQLQWKMLNTKTAYAPGGKSVEEYNLLDIYSATKYGYQNKLAYLSATNASAGTVMFESFENTYNYDGTDYFEDGLRTSDFDGTVSSIAAHSGENSLKIDNGIFTAKDLELLHVDGESATSGLILRFWAKQDNGVYLALGNAFDLELNNGFTTHTANCEVLAKTGDWVLIGSVIKAADLTAFDPTYKITPTLKFTRMFNTDVWVDDIRLQPYGSSMNCFVYDPSTQNILAQFDDQHFGRYYQYSPEGKLTRKKSRDN